MKMIPMMLIILGTGIISLSSCGDDTTLPNTDPTVPTTPVTPSKDEAMKPAEQKEYLETVAKEFLNAVPASDFKEISNLCNYVSNTYDDYYDWSEVGDWGDNAFEAVKEALNTTTHEKDDYGNHYYYRNYKAVLMAANFTGHFTAGSKKWTYEKANDLQFIFTDQKGQQCVAKVETSGNVKKVYLFDIDDWYDYEYDYDNNRYSDYYDRTQYTIGVPEKVMVTLTQGGNTVIKTTVNIDLSSISDEQFDISKDNITVSTTTELNNGYKFEVSKVAYTANTKASITGIMSKNGINLVTVATASDISGLPSVNASAFSSDSFDIDNYNTENTNAKNAFMKIDILGKVQMQGTISDVRKFSEYIENAYDNDKHESTFKSYISQANALTNIYLFYNNTATTEAQITFEPFVDETWEGTTWWTFEPVINFFDGSSYSTFEAFFNEKDFKQVINLFERLTDDYADMINL